MEETLKNKGTIKTLRGPLTELELAHLGKYPVDKDQQIALDLNEALIESQARAEKAEQYVQGQNRKTVEQLMVDHPQLKEVLDEIKTLQAKIATHQKALGDDKLVIKKTGNRVGKTTAAKGRRK